ncbi:AbrB/MazE/SpoVT family DNA-binding domain-containing protein [Clostridium sp. MSJ-11]|uniref:AbrB/MazE/SpoVT family DNA-binding domain-containing protein n=1 Tax=Clostridium mobile TaxID=2841512 RepID=A0ABS6EHH1_9CLOT|nr:AbrB/MazE/SpoVT family DNA-binding domain-containing protein [Clostridium mobile]MBU5484453.1 AbrB/MazE/SpoVT family DNA-binding domain-containing protein [Clostridium mobile]
MENDNNKASDNKHEGKYMSSVKVGAKGQIVIPKEARDLFGIKPGDTLLLLADVDRGIAIQSFDAFEHFANEVFRVKENPVEAED